ILMHFASEKYPLNKGDRGRKRVIREALGCVVTSECSLRDVVFSCPLLCSMSLVMSAALVRAVVTNKHTTAKTGTHTLTHTLSLSFKTMRFPVSVRFLYWHSKISRAGEKKSILRKSS